MAQLELRAYAKINIGLDVTRRLENGYHEVDMIMQTISLHDTLSLEKTEQAGITLQTSEETLPTDARNLAYRAAHLLMEEFKIKNGVKIKLDKRIPIAAGMAGGSSDAAAVLHGINQIFDLQLSLEELQKRGLMLGADVPYCLVGGTMRARGIGEQLLKAPRMPDCFIVVAKPAVGVSTKWVYEHLHVNQLTKHPDVDAMWEMLRQQDLVSLSKKMDNILENVTMLKCPVIGQIKKKMEESGALRAMMSGSGPTVFAIFKEKEKAQRAYEIMKESALVPELYMTEPVEGGNS